MNRGETRAVARADRGLQRFKEMEEKALLLGGESGIAKHHQAGKLTALERLDILLDKGSFIEMGKFASPMVDMMRIRDANFRDGVITGSGLISGRLVYVFAQDFTSQGGSIGSIHGEKIDELIDEAMKNGAPLIQLLDSGGARINEGVSSLGAATSILLRNVHASGLIPQISVIMGPCAGAAAYSPALTDFVIMVADSAQMFLTGPDVAKAVTHQEVTLNELGGLDVHSRMTGSAHLVADDDTHALKITHQLLSYLPQNWRDKPNQIRSFSPPDRVEPKLNSLVLDNSDSYDMREIVYDVVDGRTFFEVHERFAPNVIVGFARLDGWSVGIVGNQPRVMDAALDANACIKAARFIRTCDAFNIPVITLVDVAGFVPGKEQEERRVIIEAAKLSHAYAEATVPKVSIIPRRALGYASAVMGSKGLNVDRVWAWPSADIGLMNLEDAIEHMFGDEIRTSENPQEIRSRFLEEYRDTFEGPYYAAVHRFIDGVIEPDTTRPHLIRALTELQEKSVGHEPKKHSNMPL